MRLARTITKSGLFNRGARQVRSYVVGYDHQNAMSKPKAEHKPNFIINIRDLDPQMKSELHKHVDDKGELTEEGKEIYSQQREKVNLFFAHGMGFHM